MNEHMDKGLIVRQAFIGWMDSNEQASMNWMDGQRANEQASIHWMDGHMEKGYGQASIHSMDGYIDKGLMGRKTSIGWMDIWTKGS